MPLRVPHQVACSAATAVATLVACAAQAEPRTHDGFYLRIALGGGAIRDATDVSYNGSVALRSTASALGFAGDALAGGTVARGLVVGGGWSYNTASEPTVKFQRPGGAPDAKSQANIGAITVGPFVDYYPWRTGGAHVLGMVGPAWSARSGGSAPTNGNGQDMSLPLGIGVVVGAGYDLWVSPEWSFGVLGRFSYVDANVSGDTLGTSVEERHRTTMFSFLGTFLYN